MKSILKNYRLLTAKSLWFSILVNTLSLFLIDLILGIFPFYDYSFEESFLNNIITGVLFGYVFHKLYIFLPPKERSK